MYLALFHPSIQTSLSPVFQLLWGILRRSHTHLHSSTEFRITVHQSRSEDWLTLGNPPVNIEPGKAAFRTLGLMNRLRTTNERTLKHERLLPSDGFRFLILHIFRDVCHRLAALCRVSYLCSYSSCCSLVCSGGVPRETTQRLLTYCGNPKRTYEHCLWNGVLFF